MQLVANLGVSTVRIWGPWADIGHPDTKTERALRSAEALGLTPLFVFTPLDLPEEGYLRQQVRALALEHPTAVIETINEYDKRSCLRHFGKTKIRSPRPDWSG